MRRNTNWNSDLSDWTRLIPVELHVHILDLSNLYWTCSMAASFSVYTSDSVRHYTTYLTVLKIKMFFGVMGSLPSTISYKEKSTTTTKNILGMMGKICCIVWCPILLEVTVVHTVVIFKHSERKAAWSGRSHKMAAHLLMVGPPRHRQWLPCSPVH